MSDVPTVVENIRFCISAAVNCSSIRITAENGLPKSKVDHSSWRGSFNSVRAMAASAINRVFGSLVNLPTKPPTTPNIPVYNGVRKDHVPAPMRLAAVVMPTPIKNPYLTPEASPITKAKPSSWSRSGIRTT